MCSDWYASQHVSHWASLVAGKRDKFWVKWRFFFNEHHELMDIVFMLKTATFHFSWPLHLVWVVRVMIFVIQGCSGTAWMGRLASQINLARVRAHCHWHLNPIYFYLVEVTGSGVSTNQNPNQSLIYGEILRSEKRRNQKKKSLGGRFSERVWRGGVNQYVWYLRIGYIVLESY